MREQRPLLSIGMIVKNEMRCLKKCLDALAPLREAIPCELVIADTGSTDGTRKLAAQYADLLFDFTWCNDFSAARNAVLDRCTGIWHLQVDADEYLDADFAELIAFITKKDRNKHQMAYVVQRNYRTFDMIEEDYSDFCALRLFYRLNGIRYVGTIHEMPAVPGKNLPGTVLSKVILHHDGYTTANIQEKQRRNLPLLEKELEASPGELRRILQCLESSYTKEDRYKYAKMAFSAAVDHHDSGEDRLYCIALLHAVVTRTGDYAFPEMPLWSATAKKLFPDSILIRSGVSYMYGIYLVNNGEYEKSIREFDDYFEALKAFESGRYDVTELSLSPVLVANKPIEMKACAAKIWCLTALARLDELAQFMRTLDFSVQPGKHSEELYFRYIDALITLWKNGKHEAEALLKKILESFTGKEKLHYETFLRLCRAAFWEADKDKKNKRYISEHQNWRLLATLGNSCDLGRFALLMDARDAARAEALLESVETPAYLPPQALLHALMLRARLPQSFFRMKSEDIAVLASGLAALLLEEPEEAMEIFAQPEKADPGMALWNYHAANELAGRVDWKMRGSIALFDFYCDRMETYLSLFCPPVLCTDKNAYALPMLARFAYYCTQGRALLRQGNELGHVRKLREALAACPGMKDMVSYLAEHREALRARAKASPELLMLAEQVRAMLARFPADDPVIEVLKASEEYKIVAHLIEE